MVGTANATSKCFAFLGVRLTLPLNSTNATSIPLRFISVFV